MEGNKKFDEISNRNENSEGESIYNSEEDYSEKSDTEDEYDSPYKKRCIDRTRQSRDCAATSNFFKNNGIRVKIARDEACKKHGEQKKQEPCTNNKNNKESMNTDETNEGEYNNDSDAEAEPRNSQEDTRCRCYMENNGNTSSQSANDKKRSEKEKEDKIKKQMQEKGKPK